MSMPTRHSVTCRTSLFARKVYIARARAILYVINVVHPMNLHYISHGIGTASSGPRVGCKFSITTCRDQLLPPVLYREIRKERIPLRVRCSAHERRIIGAIGAAGRHCYISSSPNSNKMNVCMLLAPAAQE